MEKEFAFFWSSKSPFSNWHPCTFSIDGVSFNCAEQAMMYLKAKLFDDNISASKIMRADSPSEQKTLGRKVSNFNNATWESKREEIMDTILEAKFSQNAPLRDALLKTADATICESSPYDAIWGSGLAESDHRSRDESQWPGLNLLGKSLMRVRKKLST